MTMFHHHLGEYVCYFFQAPKGRKSKQNDVPLVGRQGCVPLALFTEVGPLMGVVGKKTCLGRGVWLKNPSPLTEELFIP